MVSKLVPGALSTIAGCEAVKPFYAGRYRVKARSTGFATNGCFSIIWRAFLCSMQSCQC